MNCILVQILTDFLNQETRLTALRICLVSEGKPIKDSLQLVIRIFLLAELRI